MIRDGDYRPSFELVDTGQVRIVLLCDFLEGSADITRALEGLGVLGEEVAEQDPIAVADLRVGRGSDLLEVRRGRQLVLEAEEGGGEAAIPVVGE